MTDKTQLWESVFHTDPAYTKGFSRGGGFKGTATNALYLIRKATEIWGPIGGEWGPEIVNDAILTGGPLLNGDGVVIGHELIHCLQINLRYPGGSVPSFGQTTFVSRNKNGIFTDEEAPKKSLTDALSKALSWLGFSADIHMGLFDDNKYVNDMKEKFKVEPAADKKTNPPAAKKTTGRTLAPIDDEEVGLCVTAMKECDDMDVLRGIFAGAWSRGTKEQKEIITMAYNAAKSSLTEKA